MQMGAHHAREWPSAEHAIEWAYQLLGDYEAGDPRATKIVEQTRTTVIPVVNPDGFNASREAGELQGAAGGRSAADDTAETVNIVTHPVEYRRKNCRFLDDREGGSCLQPDVGLAAAGVDPNRNYGGFWGGPGASTDPTAADYRGPGPFSEPETRDIRSYIAGHQVTAFITNHTFTGLVLRPPAIAAQGPTVDEPAYKQLGAKMTAENGYANDPSYKLYDTTGGTEDWAYYATGAFGFTFEIGRFAFHPAYAETVAEWNGTSKYFDAKGGNVAAYYKIARFAAQKRHHAVIEGKGPKRGTVTVKKRFLTATSPVVDSSGVPGEVIRFKDKLESTTRIRKRGRFEIALNPSTRPIVAQERGEKDAGPPSAPIAFSGEAATATACADAETEDPACWNDHPFEVPDEPGKDNDSAEIRIDWATPTSDWDMLVFEDSDGDGSSEGETGPGRELGERHQQLRAGDRRRSRARQQVRDPGRQLRGRRALRRHDHVRGPGAVRAGRARALDRGRQEPQGRGRQPAQALHRPRSGQGAGPDGAAARQGARQRLSRARGSGAGQAKGRASGPAFAVRLRVGRAGSVRPAVVKG